MDRLYILEIEIFKQGKEPFKSRYFSEGMRQELRRDKLNNAVTLYYFLSLRGLIREKVGAMYLDNSEDYITNSIVSFDLDRNKHAKGEFIESNYDCANKIIKNHGETCESSILAKQFIKEWDEAVLLYSDGFKTDKVMNGKECYFDNYIADREDLFLSEILSYYADYLQKECNYLQSEEAIKETLINNEYEFLSTGKMFS